MKVSWTKGLDEQQALEVKQEFIAAARLRARMSEIVSDKIENARKEERSKDDLNNPNWAIKQAYMLGMEQAFEEILSILQ